MPELTWQEISKLRHDSANRVMKLYNMIKQEKEFLKKLDELITKHEDEK